MQSEYMSRNPTDPDLPFRTRLRRRWLPRGMKEAPALDAEAVTGPVIPRRALLMNPFYRRIRRRVLASMS